MLCSFIAPYFALSGRRCLGGGSGLPLEVGAPHDDRAGIALNRRHGLEGKGAAISAGVLASAAHAAFGGGGSYPPPDFGSSLYECAACRSERIGMVIHGVFTEPLSIYAGVRTGITIKRLDDMNRQAQPIRAPHDN